ncbi:MAG: iron-containing alcohol dehydrogenase [Synergistaceae bacterium]|jgi:alcohol dehydrogenase class IV|nr:iron-containing alcohol dehydrogenase [Synergistaceae bacterium]MBP9559116.1 iron-containing alcohol dehydrogenase [Synergistaceae bacterium]MDD4837604.1 iron-containing alcohol dehydrogenase [Synergistaceae bacterium]
MIFSECNMDLIKPFKFRMPQEVTFGSGCSRTAPEKASLLGSKRPLLITGSHMAQSEDLTWLMERSSELGMCPGHWDKVEPEPPVELLEEAAVFIRNGSYDCLIAFGGGSSMDFTKMAAVMAENPEIKVSDMVGSEKIPRKGLPTIMIPTTSGSGSEVSAVAVFSFADERMKKGISSRFLVADIALVDPELTLDLPPHITAASGMDALVHGVESFLSLGTNQFTQDLALIAISNIYSNLTECVLNGQNLKAREAQSYGSMIAGMAFSMSGTAGVHAMAYPLGGQFHVPHGEANTALLRWVMEYSLEGCEEKFIPIAKAMGVYADRMSACDSANAALKAIVELGEKIGVKTRLREFGIPKEASAEMAEAALKEVRLMSNNPRPLDFEAVKKIYENAW